MRAIERPELLDDERWNDISLRRQNSESLVQELDKEFAKRTLDEWARIFDRENVWWAPVNSVSQAIEDPVVQAAGVFAEVSGPDGSVKLVNSPADFYGTPGAPRGLSPELGQHTEEVLLEMGFDWDRIIALKERGAIP